MAAKGRLKEPSFAAFGLVLQKGGPCPCYNRRSTAVKTNQRFRASFWAWLKAKPLYIERKDNERYLPAF
ncbi:hypothetical protein BTA30_06435 [Bacillus swezeyi]|nr:hypothetical protein BTA30_06435 [Bacillus swezeyi]